MLFSEQQEVSYTQGVGGGEVDLYMCSVFSFQGVSIREFHCSGYSK